MPSPLSPDVTADETATAQIPDSLEASAAQAVVAAQAAFAAGSTRAFVEVDTTAGDETYTRLKRTLPLTRMLLPALPGLKLAVLLPDAGASALAQRDWDSDVMADKADMERVSLNGIGRWRMDDIEGVFIVAPRDSEVEDLERAVDQAGDLPIVCVNPDLINMGLTGLGLNARRLRERVIDKFVTVYYLKVYPWGVMLRVYPGDWGIWVDDLSTASGFRLIKNLDHRPSSEEVDDALDAEAEEIEGAVSAGAGFFRKVSRFMKAYMKG
jgi:hypothetical protein